MKREIIMFVASVLAGAMVTHTQVQARTPKYRTAVGTYYNYMYIETSDGNEWLLSDKQSKSNKYMKYSRKSRCYMPIFKDGQKVKVKFDTRGTKTKKDDRIVEIKIITKKY